MSAAALLEELVVPGVESGGGAQPLRICTIQFQSIHAKLTLQPLGQIGAQAGDHRTVPAGTVGRLPWPAMVERRSLAAIIACSGPCLALVRFQFRAYTYIYRLIGYLR